MGYPETPFLVHASMSELHAERELALLFDSKVMQSACHSVHYAPDMTQCRARRCPAMWQSLPR